MKGDELKNGIAAFVFIVAAIVALASAYAADARPAVTVTEQQNHDFADWVQAEQRLRQTLAASAEPHDWLFASLIPDVYGIGPDEDSLTERIDNSDAADPLLQWITGSHDGSLDRLMRDLEDQYYDDSDDALLLQTLEAMARAETFGERSAALKNAAFDLYERLARSVYGETAEQSDRAGLVYGTALTRIGDFLDWAEYDALAEICDPNASDFDQRRRAPCVVIAKRLVDESGVLSLKAQGYRLLVNFKTAPGVYEPLLREAESTLRHWPLLLTKDLLVAPENIPAVIADWKETQDDLTVAQRFFSRRNFSLPAFDSGALSVVTVAEEDEEPVLSDIDPRLIFSDTLRQAGEKLAMALEDSSDPRDWLVASMVLGYLSDDAAANDAKKDALFEKALAAAPDDAAVVQWLLSQDRKSLDFASLAQTLIRLEPDNLVTWLYSADFLADKAGVKSCKKPVSEKGPFIDDLFAKAAASNRYHNYRQDFRARLLKALKRLPALIESPEAVSGQEVILYQQGMFGAGLIDSFSFPSYHHFTGPCSPLDPQFRADRQTVCLQIMEKIATYSGMSDSIVGLRALDLLEQDSSRAMEELRKIFWGIHVASGLGAVSMFSPETMPAFLQDWNEANDETYVMRRFIERAGFSSTPPPDWSNDDLRKQLQTRERVKAKREGGKNGEAEIAD